MRMRGLLSIALAVSAGGLEACECGSVPSVLTVFTDVVFTPDGRALVLEGLDGIYVSVPPTEPPRRATADHCSQSDTGSLDCTRVSADGSKVAVLSRPTRDGTWSLSQFSIGEQEKKPRNPSPFTDTLPAEVATGVVDAAWSQDGGELVYARPGKDAGTIGVFRLAPGLEEEELVRSINLEKAPASLAGRAFIVTPWGVAYPRRTVDGIEVWFRPYDAPLFNIGKVRPECGGARFRGCVLATPDGTSLAWQEKDTYVIHVYRTQRQLDLPLGQGYAFNFTRTGMVALRMDLSPDTANVQNVDTAAVVRTVVDAVSAELSPDGETLAYLRQESAFKASARLFIGPSRLEKKDREYDVFEPATIHPLVAQNLSRGNVDHSFSGDGRFLVVSAKNKDASKATLVSLNAGTSEKLELDSVACKDCCIAAPQGALLVCLPALNGEPGPTPVDIYDLATGKKTAAADKAVDLKFIADGSGVVVLNYKSRTVTEALVVSKTGAVASLGTVARYSVSPVNGQVALLSYSGALTVTQLP